MGRVHCLADAYAFAHCLELSPLSLFLLLAQVVKLEQKHTLFIILLKIALADLNVCLSSA